MEKLINKIRRNSAVIGIMGLGYVGLPLAMAFAKKFDVIGYDVNGKTIATLKSGKSHIKDVSPDTVNTYLGSSFHPTINADHLNKCDVFIMCVPTPLNEKNEPELKYVESATATIAKVLRQDRFLILESTTYPGTTEEVIIPILEESGLKAGVNFGVAHSPERIDTGNTSAIEDIPKVVGGINDESTEIACMLYGAVLKHIVPVSDTKTAEAVKILENTFRYVNIALINEMSLIFDKMGIDTWEIVQAAITKPYGFMPFYPGPGIGGHCIPLDPYYLSYQAKKLGVIPKFIEVAGKVNQYMKIYTINLAREALSSVGKQISKSNIAVFGLAYKKNINDVRESPALYIIEEALKDVDCAIFLVDHDEYRDIDQKTMITLMRHPINIDCKNIFDKHDGMIYYGIGKGNMKHPIDIDCKNRFEIASNAPRKNYEDHTVTIT